MIVITRDSLVNGVLMIVIRLDIMLMVEFMIKLRMSHMVSLLLVDIVTVGLWVVSFIVIGTVVSDIVALVVAVVAVFMAHVWAVMRTGVIVVVSMLEWSCLAVDVVGSDNAVLLLTLGIAIVVALFVIRVVIIVTRNSVVDGMLMVLVRVHIMVIIISMVKRVMCLVISRNVRIVAMLAAITMKVAFIRIIVGLKELNDRHVDILGSHSIGLAYSGSRGRVEVLCHRDTILGVEELCDGNLVLSHEAINCLAIKKEVRNGSFHKFSHRDII